MKGFILSLQSEFYKSRKTLGFWSAIILPLLITLLVTIGFYAGSDKFIKNPPMVLWLQYSGTILGVMGSLLLPMFIVFVAYSANNIEHRSDTWKTLFTLPISKWAIYTAKFLFVCILVFLSMLLFAMCTIGFGNLLGIIKPELKFSGYSMAPQLFGIYVKLFLASTSIIAIQFLLSLLWKDFLKPMGVGFVGTIAAVILFSVHWQYNYLFPYAQPLVAMTSIKDKKVPGEKTSTLNTNIDLLTKEVLISLGIAAVIFIIGYFIVRRKSVK